MRFRSRLLLALAAVAAVPTVLLTLGVSRSVGDRLAAEYSRRVESLAVILNADIRRQGEEIESRLVRLRAVLEADNRFRQSAASGFTTERGYVLDYAEEAMGLTGLSMLQIQDETGRIVSSGHFRNDYDRIDPRLPAALARLGDRPALVRARIAEGSFLALARSAVVELGSHRLTLVGGITIDRSTLRRLARDGELGVSLLLPGEVLSSQPELEERLAGGLSPTNEVSLSLGSPGLVVAMLDLPFVPEEGALEETIDASLLVTHPLTGIAALRRGLRSWFFAVAAGTALLALLAAAWLSRVTSRPLARLAEKTAQVDLGRLDQDFETGRRDEIGSLSRTLGDMTERLRTSAVELREAERRATIGELARQVNHDIKNGLAPLRNGIRHLSEVGETSPGELPRVLGERRPMLESSLAYLEGLAANYARLSATPERVRCDVSRIATEAVAAAGARTEATVEPRLAGGVFVLADPLSLRRIFDNLLANAVDSLEGAAGAVTLSTHRSAGTEAGRFSREGGTPAVRVVVADTGRGMTEEESRRVFEDFYTTKTDGVGLGLSIVRRLVHDLQGAIRVESEPGRGTRFVIELPRATAGGDSEVPG